MDTQYTTVEEMAKVYADCRTQWEMWGGEADWWIHHERSEESQRYWGEQYDNFICRNKD